MGRLVGETVYTVIQGEDSRNEWDELIPGKLVKTPFKAVVVPSGRSVGQEGIDFALTDSITLLFFETHDFEVGTDIEVRGEKYTVDEPSFDHLSPFGTGKGGTEVHLARKETV